MENFLLDGCFPNDVTIHVKIFIYFLMKFSKLSDCHHQLHCDLLALRTTIRNFEIQKTRNKLQNTFLRFMETVNYSFSQLWNFLFNETARGWKVATVYTANARYSWEPLALVGCYSFFFSFF